MIRLQSRETRLDTTIDTPGSSPDFNLNFSKVQDLRYLQELVRDVTLALVSQRKILKGIQLLIEQSTSTSRESCERQYLTSLGRELDAYESQATVKHAWATDVLERSQQAGDMVRKFFAPNTTTL